MLVPARVLVDGLLSTIRLLNLKANPKKSSVSKPYLGSFCKKQSREPLLIRSAPIVLMVAR